MDWIVENIWKNNYLVNWLSAIGTVGAVWVSLWLARRKENNKDIEVRMFDYKEEYIWYEEEDILGNSIGQKSDTYIEDAHTYKVSGFLIFYNSSDYLKTLYDLEFVFCSSNGEEIKYNFIKISEDKKNYLSLGKNETHVVHFGMSVPKYIRTVEDILVTQNINRNKFYLTAKKENGMNFKTEIKL